ncbi:ATP-binding cassette domain-containing protein [Cellulophaga baltica]|uniref:ATP-binding cassette domain-containing protein n=1 Tax=Cellulophaga TaxID=104264 RepID=UPI001C07A55C|nr:MULTISPECIES: ATP-binding cassette domain-containing protein [Cellulophaga]MBU2995309.1 ATP-binding cassette domain-containing protein [Cellulophaga baltica]MDO6766704.1 ATP-binding cassette domain-containing protein [Cellulophaga sp. 1_MG-2023]
MVRTTDVTFSYPKKTAVFNFPDIDLNEGENLLILGKSGIGKTTLLHLLAGLLQPASGAITIDHNRLNSFSSNKLDRFRGLNIGLVFQKNYAIQSLSVIDNLQARLLFSRKSMNKTFVFDLLKQLDLLALKNSKPNELSEGQLQRLGIAMAVVHYPQVILADEPTSSLDDENCKLVIELLLQQAKRTNANLIVITHDHRIKSLFSKSIVL